MRKGLIILLLISIELILGACGSSDNQLEYVDKPVIISDNNVREKELLQKGDIDAQQKDQEKEEVIDESAEENNLSDFEVDNTVEGEVTPYQFLNLICGNAEQLSFYYREEGKEDTKVYLQKSNEEVVVTYYATDMNHNKIKIRELESNGKVHYILDDFKMIKTYEGPAEDILLYRMMEVAKTVPVSALEDDGCMVYEFEFPFIQDEMIIYHYFFYMRNNKLDKLKVQFGETVENTYVFSEFEQEIKEGELFDYPNDYEQEQFNESYNGEHMPPWWEIGNDE